MDYKRSLILMQLATPKTKYDVLTFMDSLPKTARVSRASLYRIVDELKGSGYVTSAEPRPMKNRPRGNSETLPTLFKGTHCSLDFRIRIAARSQTHHEA